jgi:hypothetical protein
MGGERQSEDEEKRLVMIRKLLSTPRHWRWMLSLIMLAGLALSACATIRPSGPVQDAKGTPLEPGGAPTGANPDTPVNSDDTPTGPQARTPFDPLPDEDKMERGAVLVDQADVLLLESYPLQIVLNVSGSLPTPCHHLRADLKQPNEQNQIEVELYSLVDPTAVCIQVLQNFDASLHLGSYADGAYTILLNGEKVGEFTQ